MKKWGWTEGYVLPNKVKHFARSLNTYSKTDAIDARLIAAYTSCYVPRPWQPANASMRQLRDLSREREQLTRMRTQAKNRLSALQAGHHPLKDTVKRLKKQLTFFDKQIAQTEDEMEQLRAADEDLARSINLLTSIPYVGVVTAYTIIAETDGFKLFENRAQLIKYAGLDIVEKQSGRSVRGQARISKRGNARLRSAPYTGLGAVGKSQSVFGHTYRAALERGMEKKQARTAVVRQVLRVAYGVYKSGQPYCEDIHRLRTTKRVGELEGSPTVTHLAS